MAAPLFLQGLLDKEGVFWREVLPSYTYSELDRTVILSKASGEEAPTKKASLSIDLCVCLPHRSYRSQSPTLPARRHPTGFTGNVLGCKVRPWVPADTQITGSTVL